MSRINFQGSAPTAPRRVPITRKSIAIRGGGEHAGLAALLQQTAEFATQAVRGASANLARANEITTLQTRLRTQEQVSDARLAELESRLAITEERGKQAEIRFEATQELQKLEILKGGSRVAAAEAHAQGERQTLLREEDARLLEDFQEFERLQLRWLQRHDPKQFEKVVNEKYHWADPDLAEEMEGIVGTTIAFGAWNRADAMIRDQLQESKTSEELESVASDVLAELLKENEHMSEGVAAAFITAMRSHVMSYAVKFSETMAESEQTALEDNARISSSQAVIASLGGSGNAKLAVAAVKREFAVTYGKSLPEAQVTNRFISIAAAAVTGEYNRGLVSVDDIERNLVDVLTEIEADEDLTINTELVEDQMAPVFADLRQEEFRKQTKEEFVRLAVIRDQYKQNDSTRPRDFIRYKIDIASAKRNIDLDSPNADALAQSYDQLFDEITNHQSRLKNQGSFESRAQEVGVYLPPGAYRGIQSSLADDGDGGQAALPFLRALANAGVGGFQLAMNIVDGTDNKLLGEMIIRGSDADADEYVQVFANRAARVQLDGLHQLYANGGKFLIGGVEVPFIPKRPGLADLANDMPISVYTKHHDRTMFMAGQRINELPVKDGKLMGLGEVLDEVADLVNTNVNGKFTILDLNGRWPGGRLVVENRFVGENATDKTRTELTGALRSFIKNSKELGYNFYGTRTFEYAGMTYFAAEGDGELGYVLQWDHAGVSGGPRAVVFNINDDPGSLGRFGVPRTKETIESIKSTAKRIRQAYERSYDVESMRRRHGTYYDPMRHPGNRYVQGIQDTYYKDNPSDGWAAELGEEFAEDVWNQKDSVRSWDEFKRMTPRERTDDPDWPLLKAARDEWARTKFYAGWEKP